MVLVEDQPVTMMKLLWYLLHVNLTTVNSISILLMYLNYLVPPSFWEIYILRFHCCNNLITVCGEKGRIWIFLCTFTWYRQLQTPPLGISREPEKVLKYWRVVVSTILLINPLVSVFICLDKLPNSHQHKQKWINTFLWCHCLTPHTMLP